MENVQLYGSYNHPITGLHLISSLNYRESIGIFTPYYYLYYDNLSASHNETLDFILFLVCSFLVLICCGLFIFHLSVILFTRFYLYGTYKTDKKINLSQIGVSILKPLNDIDEFIYANLEGFFLLEYPCYEIIFCVEEYNEELIKVLDRLIEKYPNVEAKYLVGAQTIGVNPKINNISKGFKEAKHDLILISDAGIYMHYTTLTDMVMTLMNEDNVGLVHQVPYLLPFKISNETKRIYSRLLKRNHSEKEATIDQTKDYYLKLDDTLISPSFSWTLQMVYFGCWHAKIYLGCAMTGINCTTGMSCLMRKSVIDEAPNGLKYFSKYLAEDFFISKYFYDNGWKVRISRQPAWQNTSISSVGAFHNRLMRWYQLRLKMVLLVTLVEPISQCIPNGIIHALCFSYLFPRFIDPVAFFCCHLLIWFLLDFILLHSIHPAYESTCLSKGQFFLAWTFQELTSVYLSVRAFLTTNVNWRGKIYHISWGGLSVRLRNLEQKDSNDPKKDGNEQADKASTHDQKEVDFESNYGNNEER